MSRLTLFLLLLLLMMNEILDWDCKSLESLFVTRGPSLGAKHAPIAYLVLLLFYSKVCGCLWICMK